MDPVSVVVAAVIDHHLTDGLMMAERSHALRLAAARLDAFTRCWGWTFKWVSSGQSDFNYDFQVSSRDDEREAGKAIYTFATLPPGSPSDML
ncbi:DUF899 family protein [Sorangium sp. So ce291]|uniref:DUF899 family protein n=1 Tax=Sorangium sp. So ce291 TaxID=3133294 RepID=UPI003F60F554